ncbi:MAG: 23S rRNA (uracil(1939)-C(5))-methyltransferase RlmD [Lachnospiraceae bacterium]|nr:23S rRNA (uracil(1939)-C(5))-methyltransferase RlmD [Lachnospiraceae bacterium]
MYKKNDIIQLEISTLGSEGEGIGKIDGFPFFVRGAVPGDVIEAGVTKVRKNMAFARLIRIIMSSNDRVEPTCQYFGKCGGCQLMNMNYGAQLGYKEEKVKNDLIRIGGIDKDTVEKAAQAIMAAAETLHYRNKEQYPFGTDKDGNTICGFYAYHSHRIIDQTDCLLGNKENILILEKIKEWMKVSGVTAYDETTGRGLVRHVMIRKGNITNELMVCIVINSKKLKAAELLVDMLKDIEGMTSISYSSNTENTNVIMGESSNVIWGSDHIDTVIEGNDIQITYALSPLSFYQVNSKQTERLYSKALEYADLKGRETVWDLYCGIGTISLFLAAKAAKVYGVEIVPQAIENAKNNARNNNIENAEFICGAAEEILPAFYRKNGQSPDVVVVDPPRKGCDKICLDTIINAAPRRIVYVSCDPATLARDIKYLRENGYELKAYTPCDMFPNSYHVETVCLLSRKDPV